MCFCQRLPSPPYFTLGEVASLLLLLSRAFTDDTAEHGSFNEMHFRMWNGCRFQQACREIMGVETDSRPSRFRRRFLSPDGFVDLNNDSRASPPRYLFSSRWLFDGCHRSLAF